jgi:hypothetical protein
MQMERKQPEDRACQLGAFRVLIHELFMQAKVSCQRCKKLILPMTASRTGGLCLPCFGRPQLLPTGSEHPRGIGYWRHTDGAAGLRFPDPKALVLDEFIERTLSSPVPNSGDVPAFPGVEVSWDYWLEWAEKFGGQ